MNVTNIAAYFKERFPPVNMLLFAVLFLTVYSVGSYFSIDKENSAANILVGIISVISFFYRLRVFDEIKDFKLDAINHPLRVLQCGKVSLKQLITISAALTFFEIIWSYWNGTITIISWLMAVAYSLLMRYEFFIGAFLKRKLFLYACTHMLIMPLIILWIWSAFYKNSLLHPALYLLAALSLLGGFCFEIARKIHAPAEERPTVDSYSRSLGFNASLITVLIFLLAGVLVQAALLNIIHARSWAYIAIVILYMATCIIYIHAAKMHIEKKLRFAELLVSLFMLFSYVSIITEIHFR